VPVLVIIAIVVGLVVVKLTTGNSKTPAATPENPVPAAVMDRLTSVPTSAFDAAGAPSSLVASLKPGSGSPLTSAGKPLVLYVGAEYCPYCAAERWPMVVALSRFGQFTGLKVTESSTSDIDPGTQTLSFHGATYTSPYITFQSVEEQTNQPQGDTYATLETPTAAQEKLVQTYDKPPFTNSSGGIPFIDFGNRYIVSGSAYDPATLQGQSWFQISGALSEPTGQVGQSILGTANAISAAICKLTNGQPGSVCTSAGVKAAAAQLK